MFSLIRNLMTGKYGVFWQVMLAGLLLMAIWQGFATGLLQKLFFFLLAIAFNIFEIWGNHWTEDGLFGFLLFGFVVWIGLGFLYVTILFLVFFLEYPFQTTTGLVTFILQKFWEFLKGIPTIITTFVWLLIVTYCVLAGLVGTSVLLNTYLLPSNFPLGITMLGVLIIGLFGWFHIDKWLLTERMGRFVGRLLRVFRKEP